MKINPLIPIGAKITVEKSKIENFLPNKLLNDLPQIISGEIVDYKMTDGMGIGYVLMTDHNEKIWIFNTELNEKTKSEYEIEDKNNTHNQRTNDRLIERYKITYYINGSRNINTITNPINLIKWLMFTLKDII